MRARLPQALAALSLVLVVFACTGSAGDETGAASSSSGAPGVDASAGAEGGGSSSSGGSSGGPSDAATDADAEPPVPSVKTTETMTFDGKQRSYILVLPSGYDAGKSYPLVLSFHGNPGSADGQAQYLPFESVSKTAAVVAYPQASDGNWDLYTPTDDNADMNFIAALPAEIAKKASIDGTRVYGFGYSGGGFFLPQFTCRFGGVFKAISVNAGGGPDEPQMGYDQYDNGCYKCPGGPVAAIVTHGADDSAVEPASGVFTHECFATFNGCQDSLSASTPSPCQVHDGCPADKPVKWCLIPGQSHAPWAEAMQEAWAFFTSLP